METLPGDVLRLIASWPECQLRNTSRQFRRDVPLVPFETMSELRRSLWFSRRVPCEHANPIVVASSKNGGAACIDGIYGLQAPYILIDVRDLDCVRCVLIWDDSIAPFVSSVQDCALYKLSCHLTRPYKCAADYDIQDDVLVVFNRANNTQNRVRRFVDIIDRKICPVPGYDGLVAQVYTRVYV